jgi:hypothetical protein
MFSLSTKEQYGQLEFLYKTLENIKIKGRDMLVKLAPLKLQTNNENTM